MRTILYCIFMITIAYVRLVAHWLVAHLFYWRYLLDNSVARSTVSIWNFSSSRKGTSCRILSSSTYRLSCFNLVFGCSVCSRAEPKLLTNVDKDVEIDAILLPSSASSSFFLERFDEVESSSPIPVNWTKQMKSEYFVVKTWNRVLYARCPQNRRRQHFAAFVEC